MDQHEAVTWRAAEYHYVKRDVLWFVLMGGVASLVALFALWRGNFFFFLFIVLAAVMVVVMGRRRPRVLDFSVGDEGVKIGDDAFLKYDDLENFSFRHRPNALDEIVLKKKSYINPHVRLPVDTKTSTRAIAVLENHVDRVEHDDSLIDVLAELIGF